MDSYETRYPDLAERAAAAGLEVRFADLSLTRLHYITGGDGPPLVMVPATISAISDYVGLVKFMAQRYRVYFFELPGHGLSTPFSERFSSEQVARTVAELLDSEGHERASLMGFSFGGILALVTLGFLRDRIDKVVLLSPCATYTALAHDRRRLAAIRWAIRTLRPRRAQKVAVAMLHSRPGAKLFGWFVTGIGRIEAVNNLVQNARFIPQTTLDALTYQTEEVLTYDVVRDGGRFEQPLYFGMSVNDPLIDFERTYEALKQVFGDMTVVRWDFPWHQPPEPLTFEWLDKDFRDLLLMTTGEAPVDPARVERVTQRIT